jgi:type II secretory pathway component PulK
LWAVTLLGLVALALSNSVQDEVRSATYRKEAAQAYAIACGGVEAAILAIVYPPPENPETPPFWTWKQGQREGVVPFQGGRAHLLIESESGRVDLNFASRAQLARLLEVRGVGVAAAGQLAAAIVHWRQPEDPEEPEARALDESYQRTGVHPRHDRFQSLEEVLNVRGMSREIFYGTVEVSREGTIQQKYGVGEDLTLTSGATQVNVNYASEYALRSVPGVSADLAQAIVRERKREPFRSVTEIGDRTAMLLPDESLAYLTTGEGKTYSIVSVGEIAGSPVRRAVRALVQVDYQAVPRHRVVAWYDDYGIEPL